MRDARINTIGEGANDVLKAFIAVVGMRGVGENLKGVLDAAANPLKDFSTLWGFAKNQISARLTTPQIPLHNPASLQEEAGELAKRVRDFGLGVQSTLAAFRKDALKNKPAGLSDELAIMQEVIKSQYQQERIADAACVLMVLPP